MLSENKVLLVSIMYVNNEIGTIQDIPAISRLVHSCNSLLHVDAVQAVPYIKIDIAKTGIDFLSLSAHKFYGPKGVGLAYINPKYKITPLIDGGHQENGLRAGTYNTPGIVGMAEALKLIYSERIEYKKKVKELRDYIWKELSKRIPDIRLNGSLTHRVEGNLNVSFKNISALNMITTLSDKGICVSAGSACNSKIFKPSGVIKAIGTPEEYEEGAIRISFGKFNTKKEADYLIKNTVEIFYFLKNQNAGNN
jgi:cysteine desulfurase